MEEIRFGSLEGEDEAVERSQGQTRIKQPLFQTQRINYVGKGGREATLRVRLEVLHLDREVPQGQINLQSHLHGAELHQIRVGCSETGGAVRLREPAQPGHPVLGAL